jgi:threonine dehydrogenase-like Zn-dependent dehydrogenase
MRAVVYRGVGDIGLEDVPEPKLESPTDAIVRITTTAICGTDLHLIRGTMPGMKPGTVLGHEAVGVVEEVGADARNLRPGDRVVVPSTIGCGYCTYCRAGYYAQCDNANPNGPGAGTAFFGGPESAGRFNGLQAEFARVPFAATGLVRLPDAMADDDAILLSDIFPTSWFGAELAEVGEGDTVAVFGCGVVGQLAMAAARLHGCGRIFAVDNKPSRLQHSIMQGAEPVNFDDEDPVETIKRLTGGIGVDRVIDAVGVDAERPRSGPAADAAAEEVERYEQERGSLGPEVHTEGGQWVAGNAPSLALEWAVGAVAKAGTIGIIGVYPPTDHSFPIGEAMNKNLTINAGNCNHRRYLPELIDIVASGRMSLSPNVSHALAFDEVVGAYEAFDHRDEGWLKVALVTS